MRGIFLTFEGIDGCGKSTQLRKAAEFLEQQGVPYITTREPGGSPIAEQIREILLDAKNTAMSDRTEALLYAAARAQHIDEVVLPALKEGKVVLCDRFLDSSEAYQGFGRALGGEYIRQINAYALHNMPNRTFYFRYTPEQSLARIGSRGQADRLEQQSMEFFHRVYEGFEAIAAREPERVTVLDANLTIEEIAQQVQSYLTACMRMRSL